jgi:hypothetical protein
VWQGEEPFFAKPFLSSEKQKKGFVDFFNSLFDFLDTFGSFSTSTEPFFWGSVKYLFFLEWSQTKRKLADHKLEEMEGSDCDKFYCLGCFNEKHHAMQWIIQTIARQSRWYITCNLLPEKKVKESVFLFSFFLKYDGSHRWDPSPRKG